MRQLLGAITASLLLWVCVQCTPVPVPPETGDPLPSSELPYVTLVTPQGTIVIELFTDAGTAAGIFRDYIGEGYYTGSIVHEVRPGQWIRFGLYDDLLAKLADKVVVNESDNGLTNTRGRVAMNGPFSADTGSPFILIDLGNNTGLDYQGSPVDFTVIGRVLKGLDVADAIAALEITTGTADDGTRLSNLPKETVRILEAGVGLGPLAEAGPDQTVEVNEEVTLDGTGSQPRDKNATLSYAWTQVSGPAVTLDNPAGATPKFTPSSVATLVFQLVVTEPGRSETGKDQVTITVQSSGNRPPVANAGPDQNVAGGATVTLDASGTKEPDLTDTLTYAWTQVSGPVVTLSDATAIKPTFTAPTEKGVLVFEVRVEDDEGGVATDRVQITVHIAPTADAGPDRTVLVDEQVILDGSGSRPSEDGGALVYAWSQTSGPDVTLSDASIVDPAFTPTQVGTYTFSLTVTETSTSRTGSDSVTIVVNSPTNNAPTADAGPDQTVGAGTVVTLDGTGSSDPDVGDTLGFTWTQTAGDTVTLSDASDPQPTFTAPGSAGVLTFRLEVSDGLDGSASDEVTITVLEPQAGEDHLVVPDVVVTLDGSESAAPPGKTLSFQWTQTEGPGVTLNDADTAKATFTVPGSAADGAALTFRLTVGDGQGGSAFDDIHLTVETAPVVRLETTLGDIDLEMLIDGAPRTALNFCQYVEDRFYDGTIFHRVVPNFVIQGGGFLPDLSPQEGIRDPIANEFSSDRSNVKGTVALAKFSGNPDSATCQFFVNLKDNPGLDTENGGFSVFARVLDAASQAVVDEIAGVSTSTQQDQNGNSFNNVPVEDVIITRARVR